MYSTQGIRCGVYGGRIERWIDVYTDNMLLTWLKSNSSVVVLYLSDVKYIFFFLWFCVNHWLIYVIVSCYPRFIDVAPWKKSWACVFVFCWDWSSYLEPNSSKRRAKLTASCCSGRKSLRSVLTSSFKPAGQSAVYLIGHLDTQIKFLVSPSWFVSFAASFPLTSWPSVTSVTSGPQSSRWVWLLGPLTCDISV